MVGKSFLLSANPRANHTLRTLLPSISSEYGRQHDEVIWNTARTLLGEIPGTVKVVEDARTLASLPLRMGGLGLRSVERCAHAACWASWADIAQRNPAVAEAEVQSNSDKIKPGEESVAEFKMAIDSLDRYIFWWRPRWSELRPEAHTDGEPGEWQHGWQYGSFSVSESHFTKMTMLSAQLLEGVHLRYHSGRNAGAALAGCPTCPEFTITPHLFRTLILERFCLPLQMTEELCEGCHAQFDTLGRHRASCVGSGRVQKRATPTERIVGRIFREAGAIVR